MRSKKYLIITIVVMLIVSMLALIVACDDKDGEGDETPNYSDTLFTNGNFDKVSGEDYPLAPSDWTGAPGSSSTSATLKTPNSSDDLAAGVIDIDKERNYRKQIGSVQPGKIGKDNNVLTIYNKTATAYKYSSASITVEPNSIYKLSVWCKTELYPESHSAYNTWKNSSSNVKVSKEFTGAYIYVTGTAAYAAFQGIDTSGEWQEFVLYINTKDAASGTITLSLGLGDGNWETGHMAAGYAYFDDVTLLKLNDAYRDADNTYVKGDASMSKEDALKKATAEFDSAAQGTSESKIVDGAEQTSAHKVHTAKYISALGNVQFDYETSTSTPYTSSKWSGKAGNKPDNSSHNTSSTYVQRGILDVAYMNKDIINDVASYPTLVMDTPNAADARVTYSYSSGYSRTNANVLMINNRKNNVYYYKSGSSLTVKADSYYKLSIYVKTYGDKASASVKLTYGSDSDTASLVSVDGINTDGEWQLVEMYIKGDTFRDKTFNVELWLGENNSDGCTGIAMFDSLAYESSDAAAYDTATNKGTFATERTIEYKEIGDGASGNVNYTVDDKGTREPSYAKLLKKGDSFNDETVDVAIADSNTSNVWVLDNKTPSRTSIMPEIAINSTADTSNLVKLESNSYIILSFWVKTSDIASGGLAATLYQYDIEEMNKAIASGKLTQENKGNLTDYKTSKGTLSSITSKALEQYANDAHNGYVMISFAIEGAAYKDAYVGLEFTLGSGSDADSSSYVKGHAMITNLMIEEIDVADYSSTSNAENINTVNLKDATSAGFASNGYFESPDLSATNNLYKDKVKSNDLGEFEYTDDNKWQLLPLAKGWTATNTIRMTDKLGGNNSYGYGGLLNLNTKAHRDWFASEIGSVSPFIASALSDASYASIFDSAIAQDKNCGLSIDKHPSVLAVYGKEVNKFGFSSSSVSLESNSYYRIRVWAFADAGTRISASLTTGSDNTPYGFIDVSNKTSGWQPYDLYIETGVSSINATLTLSVGSIEANEEISNNSNAALFTGAVYTKLGGEDDYNSLIENKSDNAVAVSWMVDTMDNAGESTDDLSSHSGWSGALIDSEASNDDVTAGVFDRNNHSWDTLLDLDVDGADSALLNAVFDESVSDKNINNSMATAIGNKVLTIYNHTDVLDDDGKLNGGAYKFTSNSVTLSKGSYYKITVWALTYKIGKDNSLIVSLKIGNNSYTFGQLSADNPTELESARKINTSTYADDGTETVGKWREISFYVYVEEDVTETVSASLTLQLGDDDEWVSGYAFFDNFSCVKVSAPESGSEIDVIAGRLGFTPTEKDDKDNDIFSDKNGYIDGKPVAALSSNYVIRYTQADAEKAPDPEDEETPEKKDNQFLWAYITGGIIGGLIVLVVAVVIIKKIMTKRKRSKQVSKKSSYDRSNTASSGRNKFSGK